jgi:hypothetical protein
MPYNFANKQAKKCFRPTYYKAPPAPLWLIVTGRAGLGNGLALFVAVLFVMAAEAAELGVGILIIAEVP